MNYHVNKIKIENIALIEIIEINFEKGLNIITGDSGSGKSLILESLNALFGGTNIPQTFNTSRKRLLCY